MCLAVPGRIEEITDDEGELLSRQGRVNFGGVIKEISLAYVPEAVVGNYVVVHVGFALSIVDEREAQKFFEHMEELGEME